MTWWREGAARISKSGPRTTRWDPTATPKWVSIGDNLGGALSSRPWGGARAARGEVSPLKALGTPQRAPCTARTGWTPGVLRASQRPGEGRRTWGGRSRWRQRSESGLKWALPGEASIGAADRPQKPPFGGRFLDFSSMCCTSQLACLCGMISLKPPFKKKKK